MKLILSVGAVIIKERKVLLVGHTEAATHLTGVYGLPSGSVEKEEEPLKACIRELREETGLIADPKTTKRISEIFMADIETKKGMKRFIWLVYNVKTFSGKIKISEEQTYPFWHDLDKLDKIELLPNVKNAIQNVIKEN